MATWTFGVGTTSTNNVTSYTSSALTPAIGDLLVVGVVAGDTAAAAPTLTSASAPTTFTLVRTQQSGAGLNREYLFVADSLVAAATSRTLIFDCTGDAATGVYIGIMRLSGMTRTGLNAVKNLGGASNVAAGTPTAALDAGATSDTNNAMLSFIGNQTNPAGVTVPTGWTSHFNSGFATPTTGFGLGVRNSGHASTTVTWGSASASAYGIIIAEFDITSISVDEGMPYIGGGYYG